MGAVIRELDAAGGREVVRFAPRPVVVAGPNPLRQAETGPSEPGR
jgi:hypothetical protein